MAKTHFEIKTKPKSKKPSPDEVFYNYYVTNTEILVSKDILRKSRATIVLVIKRGTLPEEAFAKFKLNNNLTQ